jgi:uncharacterized repeat protein (TIGR03803 family)
MKFKNSAEALTVRQEAARRLSNSCFKATIFAALMVLGAGAFAGAQSAATAPTVSTVYNFAGGTTGSANPWYVTLVQGTDGQLYGTTYNGGSASAGTAFKVSTAGVYTLLHSFANTASDGGYPSGGLTLGSNGNFYGTTQQGGTANQGVVFQMTSAGAITILHNFNAGLDGAFPWGPPILASDGNLYGTASGGAGAFGLLYKVTTTGTYSTVYAFSAADGYYPMASPTQGIDGNLYVPVALGGSEFCGTIDKITTAGVLVSSYSFPCGAGGSFPVGPLVQDANTNFFSTTMDGGTNGEGTIYKITPTMVVTILHSFGATFGDGEYPSAGLALGTDGKYYGSAAEGGTYDDGILFNTQKTGFYTDLYSFNNSANLMQESPLSPPVEYTTGLLYGVTEYGGTTNQGTVYSLNNGLTAFVNAPSFYGREGSNVLLLGNDFQYASQVTFNGVPANFTAKSNTHMMATVPAGATSGYIEVTTPAGVVKSRKLFVVQK